MNGVRFRTGSDDPDGISRLVRYADRPDTWPALDRSHGEELADLLSPGGLVLIDVHYLDEEGVSGCCQNVSCPA